jgi:hypothetical protein
MDGLKSLAEGVFLFAKSGENEQRGQETTD